MPNANPIKVEKPVIDTSFTLDPKYKNEMIYLTVSIDLSDPAWSYTDLVIIYLNGENIYPVSTPAPVKLSLCTGDELNGKKLLIKSNFALIHKAGGFSGSLPVYGYKLSFDTQSENIETFSEKSVQKNPTHFNSLSSFVQLP